MHVLIVEDDGRQRSVLERWLRDHGHTTASAWTVAGAEKSLEKEHFDAVILDLGIDGDPEAGFEIPAMVVRGTPIIVLSGADEATMRARAVVNRLEGMIKWVQKPLRLQDLHDLLTTLAPKEPSP